MFLNMLLFCVFVGFRNLLLKTGAIVNFKTDSFVPYNTYKNGVINIILAYVNYFIFLYLKLMTFKLGCQSFLLILKA